MQMLPASTSAQVLLSLLLGVSVSLQAQEHRAVSELVLQVIDCGEIRLCANAPGVAVRGFWVWIWALTIGLSLC